MAELEPVPDPASSPPLRWRPVRRWAPAPRVWAFWALVFWTALVLLHVAPALGFLAPSLAIVAVLAAWWAAYMIYVLILAPQIARRAGAAPTPPPPASAYPDEVYVTPPCPIYPPVQEARGQCGWVQLRLRVDAEGRVRAYQVVQQAPGRVFEASAAQALPRARLPAGQAREVLSLITFITADPEMPDWAAARSSATPEEG